ncbi:hypothetical protein PHLGIDRAFT_302452 [Phlebiopsis gigantea 11061_1 CR5-6]|uniref:Uncharacterized protein n=1 Tax=Phlebiopsis gigantea (strain 11061_1 CR5-6) TaxID=745531 RepID=A0A0C3SB57_PHLG1|nr:hypothetical protein PHLGIDRAFT_302452 [Phlebiopsis gigantea 11061_1 CR5-6]
MGRIPSVLPKTHFESTGLLQLTWLLGQESRISERIADIVEPTDNNLRRAGLFEVNLGDTASQGLSRRTSTPQVFT